MKLSIGNQPIALPLDENISIEKTSPVLNDSSTSFSYPFPVPRLPNQLALGDPGKLERLAGLGWQLFTPPLWELLPPTFILEDQGMQVLTGEVDFDDITEKEIGIVLKAGSSEFWSKIKDQKMVDVDFGSEDWLGDLTTLALIEAKQAEWDAYNAAENAPVIAVQWLMDNEDKSAEILGNVFHTFQSDPEYVPFMLQFRAWYLIEKIFEHYGYIVTIDNLKTDEFSQLIVFTRPFYFTFLGTFESGFVVNPPVYSFNYAELMPDITVQDFLDGIKSIPGLTFLIDDQKKEVSIAFQRELFLDENIDLMPITELKGWTHRESEKWNGYQLAYQSQDDENDTKIDYIINLTVEDTLPAITAEGTVVHVNSVNMDYITKKRASDSSLYWSMIGRLKPYISLKGGLEIEFPVKVPQTHDLDDVMHPYLGIDTARKNGIVSLYNSDMSELYVSLYRGIVLYGEYYPLICAEKWRSDATPSLATADLYASCFADYLLWKQIAARPFTKYIQLTLPQLLSLQWNRRYMISGIRVIFDKINYELPFTGIVKVDGYTA